MQIMHQQKTYFVISVIALVFITTLSVWMSNMLVLPKTTMTQNLKASELSAFGLRRQPFSSSDKPHEPCSEEYRQNHWIAADGGGRLGNQMFRLAGLLATAKLTCRTPVISERMNKILGGTFNLSFIKKIDIKNETLNWKTFNEVCRHAWQLLNLNPMYNWTIYGHFESWKNFFFYEQYIKDIFEFNSKLTDRARAFLLSNAIREKCPRSTDLNIGIHMRRRDFLRLYRLGFRVADENYTIMARNYFKKQFPKNNICFIVASDDISWCKENIIGDDVFYSNLTTAGEDMALMSLCNHSIVSTGTFGWFGAWLAGGKVVYFSDYYRLDSKKCPTNGLDFIPPDWVAIP